MNFVCNKHGDNLDYCEDCLEEALDLLTDFVNTDAIYHQMLGWHKTELFERAIEFLKRFKTIQGKLQ